jgi:antiphage defense system Thoeris ThsB-like protein
MAIRVFLSFVEEDLNLVNLFRGQAKGKDANLDFHDYSIKIPFNSGNAEYIGRGIAEQVKLCTLCACLYGPTTYLSGWVNWELNKAIQLGKPIMGVCLFNDGRVKYHPASLEGRPLMFWNIPDIVATMESLAAAYRR